MLLPDTDASPFPIPSLGLEGEGGVGVGGRSTPAKRRRRYGGKVDSLQVGFPDNAASLNGSITDGDPSVNLCCVTPFGSNHLYSMVIRSICT